MSIRFHKHRILPGHMGGTYEPSNVIKLTIPEHAAWHYELWVYYGKIEDYVAWKCLLGCMSMSERKRLLQQNHFKGKKRPEHSLKMKIIMSDPTKNPMHGRVGSLNPMYGKKGILHPSYGKKFGKRQNFNSEQASKSHSQPLLAKNNFTGEMLQIDGLFRFSKERNLKYPTLYWRHKHGREYEGWTFTKIFPC